MIPPAIPTIPPEVPAIKHCAMTLIRITLSLYLISVGSY